MGSCTLVAFAHSSVRSLPSLSLSVICAPVRVQAAQSSKSSSSAKKSLSYAAERVIGNGSFGVVYQASVIDTGETVAIKKVLQDRRFKNRELDIMSTLDHPNVVCLKHWCGRHAYAQRAQQRGRGLAWII